MKVSPVVLAEVLVLRALSCGSGGGVVTNAGGDVGDGVEVIILLF